jgi:hypothetical protein
MTDVKVLKAPLSLRTPIPVRWDLNIAETVELPSLPGGIEANR